MLTLNLTVTLDSADVDSIATLAGITATNATLTSSDAITITALVTDSLDATATTGNLIVTGNAVGTTSTILGGSGTNTITFSSIGATDNAVVIGQDDVDTVETGAIAGTTTGAEVSLMLAGGDNVVTTGNVADSALSVTADAGNDSVTAVLVDGGTATDTVLSATLGEGNNTIDVDVSNNAVEIAIVTTGAGDDKLTITGATAAADIITFNAGGGTDTLDLTTSANVTSATFNLTSVENIHVKTAEASIMDAEWLSDTSYNILGSGANGTIVAAGFDDQIAVVSAEAAAASFDYSGLTFSTGLATGASGVNFDTSGNNDTVIGSSGHDLFETGTNGGTNSFDGGLGIDTYNLTTGGGEDTIINTDIDKNGTDVIDAFTKAEDDLTFSVADLNALTGATTFTVGDVLGTDAGALAAFTDNGGDVAASGVAGTFIYNDVTAELIWDASGDTTFTDTGDVVTDTAGDDIVVATLTTTVAASSILAADFVFIA